MTPELPLQTVDCTDAAPCVETHTKKNRKKMPRVLYSSIKGAPEFSVGQFQSFPDGAPEMYFLRSALWEGSVGQVGQLLDVLYPHMHSRLRESSRRKSWPSAPWSSQESRKRSRGRLGYQSIVVSQTLKRGTVLQQLITFAATAMRQKHAASAATTAPAVASQYATVLQKLGVEESRLDFFRFLRNSSYKNKS